jgi:hypothetical protein
MSNFVWSFFSIIWSQKGPVGTKRIETTELEIQNQNIIQSDQDWIHNTYRILVSEYFLYQRRQKLFWNYIAVSG